jgi:hypothetical protein
MFLRTFTAIHLQPLPVMWWPCPSFLTPISPFNFAFKNLPHPFLFPLTSGFYPASLTGVGFRSGTATPLKYLFYLGSTMWFGAIMGREVECPPLFYPRVLVTGLPFHHTPLPWDLPCNFTLSMVMTVMQ